ncbi:MAG: calcium/sodium antiporter [Paracoccaceae bacterium]|nr:MAG: calcium/sodium antiporter [Paracoccaceae bacterium]
MTYLLFVLGLCLLFFGGDWLVKGASAIALRFRVPPLVIGLTIVGFGTSTPELLVSVQAALAGAGGIALGNVVGSNLANILLILGLSAAIGPLVASFTELRRDIVWMLAASFALLPILWDGQVGRVEGVILLAGIAAYLGMALMRVGTADHTADVVVMPALRATVMVLAGLVALMVGANLMVNSATEIARAFGVSEAVIGLTIVAIGTSLPELATSVAAALKGQREIALGNVIGSNVFNVLAILGATAVIAPFGAEARFLSVDVPVMLAVSVLLVAILRFSGGMPRIAGIGFLMLYAVYVAGMAVA